MDSDSDRDAIDALFAESEAKWNKERQGFVDGMRQKDERIKVLAEQNRKLHDHSAEVLMQSLDLADAVWVWKRCFAVAAFFALSSLAYCASLLWVA